MELAGVLLSLVRRESRPGKPVAGFRWNVRARSVERVEWFGPFSGALEIASHGNAKLCE